MSDPVDEVLSPYAARGADRYGEEVTQVQHALQCADLARSAGAGPALIAAALLHDVGHLLEPPETGDAAEVDRRHEALGARWLARWFGPEVTRPIALHVAAKRYLVAVDPAYAADLSEASRASLRLQGGPLDGPACSRFAAGRSAARAVSLRRWDEAAKDPGSTPGALSDYRPLLRGLLRAS